jgi:antibiotic biosynthesis monooxygenase (ABM) superfamily enzyme
MTSSQPPIIPSVHIRALATWIVIFPLVALGLTFLGPIMGTLHPVLKAFVLTVIIVPLAVYVLVPRLLKLYVWRVKRVRERGIR